MSKGKNTTRYLVPALRLILIAVLIVATRAQETPENLHSSIQAADRDHRKRRDEWFYRGRTIRGTPSAELRRRAYQTKLSLRKKRAASARMAGQLSFSSGSWTPLGPSPLTSDASGNGTQDYGYVAGRATSVAIDPADTQGNIVYIGGAQGGIWKSTNAANTDPSTVLWTPISDDQATLAIGAIAIQPGNSDPMKSVILAATGEANSSADSYFGLGILRSADGGNTWTLIRTANNGSLSFSGLGGARMAFSSGANQTNTAVAAMATSAEGLVDGAVNAGTTRGLYTSQDAGQSWIYDVPDDPGGPIDATSATSVVYSAVAGQFFAAIRFHGFYSSFDGVNWTRLLNQPGGAVLSSTACPPQSTSNNYGCPIYRGEISVVSGRNEMYAWYVYLSVNGTVMDGGIWESVNGGVSWTSISDSGITNCGDSFGCGVEQGDYSLELLAVPNGESTDLYAGAANLFKCTNSSLNAACGSMPFMNLTHVYGCGPISAPAHVHPDQHSVAYTIPTAGTDSGNALMFFANDGGIYRALNGYSGLDTGECSGSNQFDDLNQNLGSMAQFVSFSQDPRNADAMLGGTQGNGSPATNHATTNSSWGNVLGGDGGYNAIDPFITANFYASNPDVPSGGLNIQLCLNGVNCHNGDFDSVVNSSTLDGDDGAFYFPFILDPGSSSMMLVGTCRIWRGPRTGGVYTVISPNFDTLGSGGCLGNEVNQVRAIAASGMPDSYGSSIIYAATSGLGPLNGPGTTPSGGRVWVTTNATGGSSYFSDVTNNGPQGSINPSQFPLSAVATDSSDATGKTAYVTVMGFTGGAGHVWKTTNAGTSWTDFSGNLPDSPVNAVVVYAPMHQVFVGTDVGVFASPTSGPSWTELGPSSDSNQLGFLPNVAVTALNVFNSGSQQLLRASTYGRGIWQFNLSMTPDFQLVISNSPQTVSIGQNAIFNGTASGLNSYSSSVTLSCAAGVTPAPTTCTPSPSVLNPGTKTPFTVAAGGAVGDYYFNVKGVGSDTNHTTHQVSAVLHVLSNGPDFALSQPNPFPTVNVGSTATSGTISVTAAPGFTGVISLTCSLVSGNGSCTVNPSTVTSIPSTPSVTVDAPTLAVGSYQMVVRGTSGSTTHTLLIPFNVGDYSLSGPTSLSTNAGGQVASTVAIAASDFYGGRINASCDASVLPGLLCSLSPLNPIVVNVGSTVQIGVTLVVPSSAPAGSYNIKIDTEDTTGAPVHDFGITLSVTQDFQLNAVPQSLTITAGQTSGPYTISIQPIGPAFSNTIVLSCPGIPTGLQCSFSPSASVVPGTGASVVMNVATVASVSPRTYPITVNGTSGSLEHAGSVNLVVQSPVVISPPKFDLAITQGFPAHVVGGATQTASVTITPNYQGSVSASCDHSAIPGSQCVLSPENPIAITANTATAITATVNLPNNMMPGAYKIILLVADASGQPSGSIQLPLAVNEDFSVSSGTPSQTVSAGQTTGNYQLTIAPNPPGSSFSGAVTLSCTKGLPQGAQCIFSPSTPQVPGDSAVNVVMSMSTASAMSESRPGLEKSRMVFAIWCFLPVLVVTGFSGQRCAGCHLRAILISGLLLLILTLCSCGGVSSSGNGGGGGSGNPTTYQVTVTGTSPGTAPDAGQSTVVTLVVD